MFFKIVMTVFLISLSAYSAVHALVFKKDSRAAFGWIAVCILMPLFGPLLYFVFGVNRVHTRAKKLTYSLSKNNNCAPFENNETISVNEDIESLIKIHKVSLQLTGFPLVGGNTVEALYSGNQAYPYMLEEINNAKEYVYLCIYIFKADGIGQRFVKALSDARARGVRVQVLIDGIGEYYSWEKVRRSLQTRDIEVRRFLPPKLIPFNININLRNHRKLLVIDDNTSFVGGMNISDEYFQTEESDKQALVDIHFKMIGDITLQLKNVFESDWNFTAGRVHKNRVAEKDISVKPVLCRTIVDGPAENLDHLSIILLTAINSAEDSIVLMTPYFLPSREIISALQAVALRGVKITIILPEKNNLAYVSWASRHMLWELLERNINIYYQPEPFEHSKLFIVDNKYSVIGSANIDPRSLRLNYEVGVEVYDSKFANQLSEYIEKKLSNCRLITLEEVDNRPLFIKIRDGIAWLFSPYL